MYSLKAVGTERYLPKTPYTEEEKRGDLLTDNPERIGRYEYKGYANRLQRQLKAVGEEFEVVESPEI
mgnify:CR=1 FL=1